MGKELKIGLAVVSTLAITFCGVLYQRVSKLKTTPAVAANAKVTDKKPAEKNGLFASSNKLTTVADDAAAADEAPAAIGSKFKWSSASEEEKSPAETATSDSPPRASYMPADDSPAGDRYAARAAEREVAEEAPAVAEPTDPEMSAVTIAEPPAAAEVGTTESDAIASEPEQPSTVANPFAQPSAPVEVAETPEITEAEETAAPEAVAIEEPRATVETPEIEELAQDEDAPARLDAEMRPAAAVGEARPSSRFITPQDDEPAAPASRYSSSQFPASAAPAAALPKRSAAASTISGGKHRLEPNENFWTVSERAYGNGGYFKALHAYNAERFPVPDELAVGDEIDVPARSELERQFPDLCPKAGRRPASQSYAVQASAKLRADGNTYVVQEGDTLFDVARYELGKASRWAELYELNRETIGDDIDYLRPGMELILPDEDGADALTRQPGSGLQR